MVPYIEKTEKKHYILYFSLFLKLQFKVWEGRLIPPPPRALKTTYGLGMIKEFQKIFTLKKVRKTEDLEKAITMTASRVVKPPLNTAGPIVSSAFIDFSSRLPRYIANS